MIDVLFCSFNRLAFTKWSLERLSETLGKSGRLICFDDGSTDGTAAWVKNFCQERGAMFRSKTPFNRLEGPVAVMNWLLEQPGAHVFAKIDSDVIVPDGWLEAAVAVMEAHPRLDLLGLEPPASRTPAPWAEGFRPHAPELGVDPAAGYARTGSVGGVCLVRRECFYGRPRMQPTRTYGGFYHWQLTEHNVVKGWIVPPLKLFLLDRLPMEPWLSLSRRYIQAGWQRPWTAYAPGDAELLWSWWPPAAAAAASPGTAPLVPPTPPGALA